MVESFTLWEEDSWMRRYKRPYPPDFRSRIVELVRAGRTVSSLEKEFDVNHMTITAWVRQAGLDSHKQAGGLTTDEKAELARLRRENARLREEKEILEKAAAWFALEAVDTPNKRSDS